MRTFVLAPNSTNYLRFDSHFQTRIISYGYAVFVKVLTSAAGPGIEAASD